MAELTCPSFGTGSVDFNALNDAALKAEKSGKPIDLAAVIASATTTVSPVEAPAPIVAADQPATDPT